MQPKEVAVVYNCRCQDILASLAFLRNKKAHVYIKHGTRLQKPLAQQLGALLKTQPYILDVTIVPNFNRYKFIAPDWDKPLEAFKNYQRDHIIDCTHWTDPRWRAIHGLKGDARQWLFKIYNQEYYRSPFLIAPKIEVPSYAIIAYEQRYETVQDFSNIQLIMPTVEVHNQQLITTAVLLNNSKLYIGNNQLYNWLAQGLNIKRYIARSYGSDLKSQYSFGGLTHLQQLLNADNLLKGL